MRNAGAPPPLNIGGASPPSPPNTGEPAPQIFCPLHFLFFGEMQNFIHLGRGQIRRGGKKEKESRQDYLPACLASARPPVIVCPTGSL
jgi:hypothetical protein